MIAVTAVACAAMARDLGPGAILGLAFLAPLLGALLAGGVPRGERGRFTASVAGGLGAGACLWFANVFFRQSTYPSIGGPGSGPFTEALFGGILGALVGLIVGVAASIGYRPHRHRFTVREMMIAVVLSACLLFLLASFLRADGGVRALIVLVVVVAGVPPLILIDLLGKKSRSADVVVPGGARHGLPPTGTERAWSALHQPAQTEPMVGQDGDELPGSGMIRARAE